MKSRNGALHFLPRRLRNLNLPSGSFWVMSRRGNVRLASSFAAGVMAFEYAGRQVQRTVLEHGVVSRFWNSDPRRPDVIASPERGLVTVSTIFLGCSHGITEHGPLLFETMVFGGGQNGEQRRYATRKQALRGHAAIVRSLGVDGIADRLSEAERTGEV
jgi:hypothetical protein